MDVFSATPVAAFTKDTAPAHAHHQSLRDESSSHGCGLPGMVATGDDSDSDSESSSRSGLHQIDCVDPSHLATTSTTFAEPVRRVRKVQFVGVETRVYSITLGDHPLASMYPVSLDWSYNIVGTQPIEAYEQELAARPRNIDIPAGRGIQAPKLLVTDRMSRLVDVTGMSSRELYNSERKRQAMLREEKRLSRASQHFL